MEDYFSLLSGKFGKEEAERRINAKISSFSGLLTREAAAKLIAAEEGLIKERPVQVAQVKEGAVDVTVRGKIKKIFPIQEYPTGKRSRSFLLQDETGEIEIKLWNEDADSVRDFHLGDVAKVKNAYVRNGILNIGYRGKVEIEGREELLTPSGLREGLVSCMGKVSQISGMNGKDFLFTISDGKKEVQVCIAHMPGRGKKLCVGDTVLLEGAECGGGRLFLGEHSRILVKKNLPGMFRGELGDFDVGPDWSELKVGGEAFLLPTGELAKFLKLDGLKKDIDLPAVARMKLADLRGRRATVLFTEKEGKKYAKEISLR